jgi:hypothetical protein
VGVGVVTIVVTFPFFRVAVVVVGLPPLAEALAVVILGAADVVLVIGFVVAGFVDAAVMPFCVMMVGTAGLDAELKGLFEVVVIVELVLEPLAPH